MFRGLGVQGFRGFRSLGVGGLKLRVGFLGLGSALENPTKLWVKAVKGLGGQ